MSFADRVRWSKDRDPRTPSQPDVERLAKDVVMRWPSPAYPYNLYGPVTDAVRHTLASLTPPTQEVGDERAAIVKWLRDKTRRKPNHYEHIADAIERGDHLSQQPSKDSLSDIGGVEDE